MSKATDNFPTRACIFDVMCVDWGVSSRSGQPMARFYNLTYRWEQLDRDSGRPNGKFDAPSPLVISENWSTCLEALRRAIGPVTTTFGMSGEVWEPLFIVGGCEYSVRLQKEIKSLLWRWHAARRCRKSLDSIVGLKWHAVDYSFNPPHYER